MDIILFVFIILLPYNNGLLFQGDSCIVPKTQEFGTCVIIHECIFAKTLLKNGENPQFCGFNGMDPLVCCPVRTLKTSKARGICSRLMCHAYYAEYETSRTDELISEVFAQEYHPASIGYGNENNISWLCFGAIISHYFVLSAAHCAKLNGFGKARWIYSGSQNENLKTIKIRQIFKHPAYKPSSYYHDIALFKSEKKIESGILFQPACLHTRKKIPNNVSQLTRLGFLETAEVKIVDHDVCSKKINISKTHLKKGIIDRLQLCVGNLSRQYQNSIRFSGALFYIVETKNRIAKHIVVAGIASFGTNSGVGIYTKVSAYVEWIENIVCNNQFLNSLKIINITGVESVEEKTCTISETKDSGQCMNIHKCSLATVKSNLQTCGLNKNESLVCCPSHSLNNGTLSQQMCNKYFDYRVQVHAIDVGLKARSKEFPHMAAVGYCNDKSNIIWLCGGTLISHYFILSAAHCADSLEFGQARWVRLGDLDLQNTTDDANPQDIKIAKIYIHHLYKSFSHYHDIALFRLEEYVPFALYYKPACLQSGNIIPVETLGIIGWGQQGFNGDRSSHLLKANVKVVDHQTCAKRYSNVSTRKLKDGILDEFQLCAGDADGRDTCPGDSGGPLHYWIEPNEIFYGHYVITGVTSFGKGCGGINSVGVYTRVSAYIGWIESIVWNGYD